MSRTAGSSPIESVSIPVHIESNSPMLLSGVPIEMINYFDVDTKTLDDKQRNKLNDIYSFLNDKSKEGSLFSKLRELELKLGSTEIHEKRYNKIWNYLTISNKIKEMEDERRLMER